MNTSDCLLENYFLKKISPDHIKLLSYYNYDVPACLNLVIAEEKSRDFFSLNWEKLQQALEHPRFLVAHIGWWYLHKVIPRVKVQTREFFQMHYWRGPDSHVFRHMIQSPFGAALVATHCEDLLEWLSWQPQQLLFVIQQSMGALKIKAQTLFVQAAKQRFWEYLPYLAKLNNRNELLAQINPPKTTSFSAYWNHHQALQHQDAWVKNTAVQASGILKITSRNISPKK